MIILQAKDFINRLELDSHIQVLLENKEASPDQYCISGTRAELKRLFLSSKTKVYGVPCEATDETKEDQSPPAKPDRGIQTDFGIDSKLKTKNPNLK